MKFKEFHRPFKYNFLSTKISCYPHFFIDAFVTYIVKIFQNVLWKPYLFVYSEDLYVCSRISFLFPFVRWKYNIIKIKSYIKSIKLHLMLNVLASTDQHMQLLIATLILLANTPILGLKQSIVMMKMNCFCGMVDQQKT